MPAKKDPVPPESEEPKDFRFRVLTDNFVVDGEDGRRGRTVTLPSDGNTAANVEAGHLEPLSKSAAAAVEEVADES